MKKSQCLQLIGILVVLAGCSVGQEAHSNANAIIHWGNGGEEQVHISPSNEHLIFSHVELAGSDIVVYSRIRGAGKNKCEYYVNEPLPHVRLTLCGDGNVELLNRGRTINVGKLIVFK
ncbi:hypothetical protein [Enterovibrio baiacu]|uniref:hypothetical protein n=1 Tax=Enterovibrio baiacu TaxID=2491023 RepID=UPI003D0C905D